VAISFFRYDAEVGEFAGGGAQTAVTRTTAVWRSEDTEFKICRYSLTASSLIELAHDYFRDLSIHKECRSFEPATNDGRRSAPKAWPKGPGVKPPMTDNDRLRTPRREGSEVKPNRENRESYRSDSRRCCTTTEEQGVLSHSPFIRSFQSVGTPLDPRSLLRLARGLCRPAVPSRLRNIRTYHVLLTVHRERGANCSSPDCHIYPH